MYVLPNLRACRETGAASGKPKSFSPYDQQYHWRGQGEHVNSARTGGNGRTI